MNASAGQDDASLGQVVPINYRDDVIGDQVDVIPDQVDQISYLVDASTDQASVTGGETSAIRDQVDEIIYGDGAASRGVGALI